MSNHNGCYYDCGATDCTGTKTRPDPPIVVYLSDRGIEYKTVKEAAIDNIKCQPFFSPDHR